MPTPKLVLYVEDEPSHVQLAQRILELKGIEVEAASDGPNALRYLSARLPDLLLVDLGIPGRGGLALIRTIREQEALRDLPIIAVSASTARGEARQSLAAGADAFLEKPYTINALLAELKSVSGRSRG